MNSPVRETPADLQVTIPYIIHVSVDSVLVKKRKHQNGLRSRKSYRKNFSKVYTYEQMASALERTWHVKSLRRMATGALKMFLQWVIALLPCLLGNHGL